MRRCDLEIQSSPAGASSKPVVYCRGKIIPDLYPAGNRGTSHAYRGKPSGKGQTPPIGETGSRLGYRGKPSGKDQTPPIIEKGM
jgi:hypothetical protein